FWFFFFFFQAEDGIRDLTVTGVQTCALPISVRFLARGEFRRRSAGGAARGDRPPVFYDAGRRLADVQLAVGMVAVSVALRSQPRSEERRVGKECRSRWGRDE